MWDTHIFSTPHQNNTLNTKRQLHRPHRTFKANSLSHNSLSLHMYYTVCVCVCVCCVCVLQGLRSWWACTARTRLAMMWSEATAPHTSPFRPDSECITLLTLPQKHFIAVLDSPPLTSSICFHTRYYLNRRYKNRHVCFPQTYENNSHVCSWIHIKTSEIHEVRVHYYHYPYSCMSTHLLNTVTWL